MDRNLNKKLMVRDKSENRDKAQPLAVGREAAAQMLGVSPALLRKQYATRDPNGVPFLRIGRRVLYRVDDLKVYMAKRVGNPDEMSASPEGR